MSVDITEFVEIDPANVDAVFKAANGTDFLMIKQVGDTDADEKKEPDDDDDEKAEKAEFCGDPTCEVCIGQASKGRLSMEQRRAIPKSEYALPEKAPASGSYPINDRRHARAAMRLRGHASPEDQARIKRAVAAKYPDIGKGKKKKGKKASNQDMPGQAAQEHEGTPSPSSLMGQTNANQRHQATMKDNRPEGAGTQMRDGGRPPEEGHGGGDTAPDKELHIDEAKSQTNTRVGAQTSRENASKEVADMKGDPMPKARDEGAEAGGEASAQTEHNKRGSAPADHIRDQQTRQDEQAQKGFKIKLKKGGKKKHKKQGPLAFSAAMKETDPRRVLSEALASKEFDDMTGAELAEVLVSTLDARDARKAAERKERKAKKKAKAEKKAAKQAKRTDGGKPEEAAEAAKSATPESLVDGLGARVEAAMKTALSPVLRDIENLKNQPARPRLAINNSADPKAVLRDQRTPGGESPMDVLKPLEDAFKSVANPLDVVQLPDGRRMTKEKLGNELTTARFIIAERIRQGQPVSQADAAIAAASR